MMIFPFYNSPIFISIVAISSGSALGALLRWQLSVRLNPILINLPMGTWLANVIGAYFIGLSMAYFQSQTQILESLRLFIITGLLGGLTTFSTFTLESFQLLQKNEWQAALLHLIAHVLGCLICCFLGMITWRSLV